MAPPTFRARAISGNDFFDDLNDIAEVREITLSPGIIDRSAVSKSVMPSAKYSSAGSPERLRNGRTTNDRNGAETDVAGARRHARNVSVDTTAVTSASTAAAAMAPRLHRTRRHGGIAPAAPSATF